MVINKLRSTRPALLLLAVVLVGCAGEQPKLDVHAFIQSWEEEGKKLPDEAASLTESQLECPRSDGGTALVVPAFPQAVTITIPAGVEGLEIDRGDDVSVVYVEPERFVTPIIVVLPRQANHLKKELKACWRTLAGFLGNGTARDYRSSLEDLLAMADEERFRFSLAQGRDALTEAGGSENEAAKSLLGLLLRMSQELWEDRDKVYWTDLGRNRAYVVPFGSPKGELAGEIYVFGREGMFVGWVLYPEGDARLSTALQIARSLSHTSRMTRPGHESMNAMAGHYRIRGQAAQ